jgi:hypothetical protein
VGCVVFIGHDNEEVPRFAVVKEMCIVEESLDNLWLVTEGLLTTCFNQHLNAYEVMPITEDNLVLLKQHHLPYGFPLHSINIKQDGHVKTCICPKYQLPPI